MVLSGVASVGARGAECPFDSEKIVKNLEKEGNNQEKRGKIGKKSEKNSVRKGQNREGSFTLPLLKIGLAWGGGHSHMEVTGMCGHDPKVGVFR